MLLFIWLMFAGLTAFIASQKGRNVLGWGLIGLIFGIFAVVAIAFAKDISKG